MFCFMYPHVCKRWGSEKIFFGRSPREIVPPPVKPWRRPWLGPNCALPDSLVQRTTAPIPETSHPHEGHQPGGPRAPKHVKTAVPLKAARREPRDAIANLKWLLGPRTPETLFRWLHLHSLCGATVFDSHQRHLLLTFGNVWLGSVCRAQRVATKQNAEFTKDGWELQSYFKPFVDQRSRNFQTM